MAYVIIVKELDKFSNDWFYGLLDHDFSSMDEAKAHARVRVQQEGRQRLTSDNPFRRPSFKTYKIFLETQIEEIDRDQKTPEDIWEQGVDT